VFLTQSHPKQTEGSDVYVGTSLDQMYAQRFGQDTPIPSMQLCIENVDQAGGCAYGYACVYTDSISWASPTEPLPMIRDPRVAFELLFGAGGTNEDRAMRAARATQHPRLDVGEMARSSASSAPTTAPPGPVPREHPRGRAPHPAVEARNTSGEERELPEAPAGVPDSFAEHVQLMFDIQVLAFASDMTRVFSFKMGRDASSRVYPRAAPTSRSTPRRTTAARERGVKEFNMINKYHVSLLPYFLDKLKNTRTATATCSTRR
jgi:hypothetical protein